MTNAKYKAERRVEALETKTCSICLRRKSRKGRVTCKPCCIAAGKRRDKYRKEERAARKALEQKKLLKVTERQTRRKVA